jgi:hypothetical protein
MTLNDLYENLKVKGYCGSIRSLRTRTTDLRKKLKKKEIFFLRQARPCGGKVIRFRNMDGLNFCPIVV